MLWPVPYLGKNDLIPAPANPAISLSHISGGVEAGTPSAWRVDLVEFFFL